MTPELRTYCQRVKAAMLAERDPWLTDWRQVADYVDPYAGQFLQVRNGRKGSPNRARIINSKATTACITMDAGFMGGHTSKSRPWFRMTPSDPTIAERADVAAWCDDVSQLIRDTLAKSNFYTELPKAYHSRHLFGVMALACDEDEIDTVRFYARSIGTYAHSLNHRGVSDRFWYEYEQTARQIKQAFGEDGLPDTVREALRSSAEKTFMVQSLIEPNEDAAPGLQRKDRRPFRQIYWIDGADADRHGCLAIDGHYEMPVRVGRWDASTGKAYGPSPALNALGDIKQLQYLESKKLKLIDLSADPPLGLPDALRNKGGSLEPGSRTYITPLQTQQTVGPLYTPVPGAVERVQNEIMQVEARVERTFFADLFRMLDFLDDRQRTAYEISERKEEKVAMLGPALESLTDDVLDPVVERVYGILDRRGMIPPAPDVLDGVPVKVEYTSMLAQAQKAAGLGTIERTLGFVASAFQATGGQRADVWDKIDFDQMIDEFHDRNGGPARMIVSDEDVAAGRQQRAQQAQMQQLAALAPALKQGADAMKAAGETVPREGSALEAMSQ